MTAVAESAHGIWTQPLQAVNWSDVSGASLAPKSTVRAVIGRDAAARADRAVLELVRRSAEPIGR